MIGAALRVASDIANRVSRPEAIAVVYFAKIPNVGDLLNPYMIPKLSKKPIYRARSAFLPHLRAIGSVVGSATAQSYIWGSGSIDGRVPAKGIDPAKVYALRGKRSWDMLNRAFGLKTQMPLGDPAVLMPDFYNPAVEQQHPCGLIPHFSDLPFAQELAKELPDLKIIDVRQKPESFIDDLKSCQFVMSSSLHGLILADSYQIPNVWVKFSDRLLGGEWKFFDYYSTTDAPKAPALDINRRDILSEVFSGIREHASVKRNVEGREGLYESFSHLSEFLD